MLYCRRKLTGVPYQQELNAIQREGFALRAELCAVSASSAPSARVPSGRCVLLSIGRDLNFGAGALWALRSPFDRSRCLFREAQREWVRAHRHVGARELPAADFITDAL